MMRGSSKVFVVDVDTVLQPFLPHTTFSIKRCLTREQYIERYSIDANTVIQLHRNLSKLGELKCEELCVKIGYPDLAVDLNWM